MRENSYFKVLDIFIFNDNISCGIKIDDLFWKNFVNSKPSKLFLKFNDKKYFLEYVGQEVARGIYVKILRVKFFAKLDSALKQEILDSQDVYVGISDWKKTF